MAQVHVSCDLLALWFDPAIFPSQAQVSNHQAMAGFKPSSKYFIINNILINK